MGLFRQSFFPLDAGPFGPGLDVGVGVGDEVGPSGVVGDQWVAGLSRCDVVLVGITTGPEETVAKFGGSARVATQSGITDIGKKRGNGDMG